MSDNDVLPSVIPRCDDKPDRQSFLLSGEREILNMQVWLTKYKNSVTGARLLHGEAKEQFHKIHKTAWITRSQA